MQIQIAKQILGSIRMSQQQVSKAVDATSQQGCSS
jgi:hypothetical protein